MKASEVEKEFIALKDSVYTGKELVFDSDSGELIIKPIGTSPDEQVLDQLTEDGFFNIEIEIKEYETLDI